MHNRGTVNEMLGRFRLEGPLAVVTKNSLCLLRAWGEVEGKPEILTTCPPLQMDENACGWELLNTARLVVLLLVLAGRIFLPSDSMQHP